MERVEDQAEITKLIYRYPELIDAGDFEGIADLFARATIRSGHQEFSGRQTLLDLWRGWVRVHPGGQTLTKHVVTNVVVDVAESGTEARSRSYVTVLQAKPPELPLQIIASGRHHDAFARLEGRWHFTERVDITDLVGDLRWHTTAPYSSDPSSPSREEAP